MYILVRRNKVIDFCDARYHYVGNVVVNDATLSSFEDATIIDIGDTPLPNDILCKDYYYSQGSFIKVHNDLKSIVLESVLFAKNWDSDNTYSLNHPSIKSDTIIELLPSKQITVEQLEALQDANIIGGDQYGDMEGNYIILRSMGVVPTIDIPITLVIRGDS